MYCSNVLVWTVLHLTKKHWTKKNVGHPDLNVIENQYVFITCVPGCENSSTWRPSNYVDRVLVPREVAQALRFNLALLVNHKLPYLKVKKDIVHGF